MANFIYKPGADPVDEAAILYYHSIPVYIVDHFYNELNGEMLVRIEQVDGKNDRWANGWVAHKDLKERL